MATKVTEDKQWTQEEMDIVRTAHALTCAQLAAKLNRSVRSIESKRGRLLRPSAPSQVRRPGAKPGEAHHKAKLTEALVKEIRQVYAAGGKSMFSVWEEYLDVVDVSLSTFTSALTRKTWKHV